jgi:glyoxylase-like metal-dependent hydrolase (beta-lactamase superfamily II)
VSDTKIQIAAIVSAPFDENTYVAHLEGRNDCLVFDPGFEPELILEYLEKQQLTPAAILCTHGHSDHIAGNAALKERWPKARVVIGAGDAPMLTDPQLNLSAPFGFEITSPPADKVLHEGEIYEAAGMSFEIREIPGHSPGHIVFIWRGAEPAYVFGGDVLFSGSIGRTDFPRGSFPQLKAGIQQKLFTLPSETIVLPGHGPATTVGEEHENNPFVGKRAD